MENIFNFTKDGIIFLVMASLIILSEQYELHTLTIILLSILSLTIIIPLICLLKNKKSKCNMWTIKKGHRRPCWQLQLPIIYTKNKKQKEKIFSFCSNSVYKFDNVDDHDKNKLFGFGFGNHMKNSVRFGWNCDNKEDKISIYTYTHYDGMVIKDFLFKSKINKVYKYVINYENDSVTYIIKDGISNDILCEKTQDLPGVYKWWGYSLGIYFGGNQKCPHDIDIMQY